MNSTPTRKGQATVISGSFDAVNFRAVIRKRGSPFLWSPEFWFKYCYINSDWLPQSSHSKVRSSASSSAMKTVVADGLRVPRLGAKENPGAKAGAFGLESSVSAVVKARQPRP
jgi:hypothetical protein